MPTSAYFSDVKVEIAFDSGFMTPLASRTYTDVSQWVELSQGIAIGYGRSDERSTADANTLSLTLDNSDGRFTPRKSSSPYYPNVKLYRPIRVTARPPAGMTSTRFAGYITQWPVAWNGSDQYASANLAAVSRLGRLGLTEVRRSQIEETYLLNSPVSYWTMADPAGSSRAANSSWRRSFPLKVYQGAVTFGTAQGPTSDGLTAVTTGAQPGFLSGESSTPMVAASSDFTIAEYVTVNSTSGADVTLVAAYSATNELVVRMMVTPAGFLRTEYYNPSGTLITGHLASAPINTNTPLLISVVVSGNQGTCYVNGASASGTTAALGSMSAITRIAVSSGTLTTDHAHLAVYDSALAPSSMAAMAGAPFGLESGASKFARYASWVGIPTSELDISALSRLHVPVDSTGKGVVELMQQVATSESAVLYDKRDGFLALAGESLRYTTSSAFTLDMTQQQVESDFAPTLDPSRLRNVVTVTRSDGLVSATVSDTNSINDYGIATETVETTTSADDDPESLASWLIGAYAEPRSRVSSISVDVAAQTGSTPTPNTILNADIHTLFTVTNLPSQAENATESYFVEGYTETIAPESHVITFNVSPSFPAGSTVLFNDAARGFGSGSVFAY